MKLKTCLALWLQGAGIAKCRGYSRKLGISEPLLCAPIVGKGVNVELFYCESRATAHLKSSSIQHLCTGTTIRYTARRFLSPAIGSLMSICERTMSKRYMRCGPIFAPLWENLYADPPFEIGLRSLSPAPSCTTNTGARHSVSSSAGRSCAASIGSCMIVSVHQVRNGSGQVDEWAGGLMAIKFSSEVFQVITTNTVIKLAPCPCLYQKPGKLPKIRGCDQAAGVNYKV